MDLLRRVQIIVATKKQDSINQSHSVYKIMRTDSDSVILTLTKTQLKRLVTELVEVQMSLLNPLMFLQTPHQGSFLFCLTVR